MNKKDLVNIHKESKEKERKRLKDIEIAKQLEIEKKIKEKEEKKRLKEKKKWEEEQLKLKSIIYIYIYYLLDELFGLFIKQSELVDDVVNVYDINGNYQYNVKHGILLIKYFSKCYWWICWSIYSSNVLLQ
jgi:hypothetical protein